MDSDKITQILDRKRSSDDTRSLCIITPPPDKWNRIHRDSDFYMEAFGDTSDKIVIHPGHFGWPFDYTWGRGLWSSETCWNNEQNNKMFQTTDERIRYSESQAKEFYQFAKTLRHMGNRVKVLCMDGGDKRSLDCELTESLKIIKERWSDADIVLFVYCKDLSDIKTHKQEDSDLGSD